MESINIFCSKLLWGNRNLVYVYTAIWDKRGMRCLSYDSFQFVLYSVYLISSRAFQCDLYLLHC